MRKPREENSLGRAAVRRLAPAVLGVYLIAAVGFLGVVLNAGFHSLRDIGYGSSYILFDILHFEKTGIIYHSLSQPPYLPVLYSPAVYILYGFSRYFSFANIFLGPRLIAFATFLLCVGTIASVVKKLIPVRSAWLWGILLAASIRSMDIWTLQLRGDFLGMFFAFAAIRLLMARHRYLALAAGLCAGMAIQIRLTLMAAAGAGMLWLLMRKRWKDAVLFAVGAGITSLGLFFLYWLREPDMIQHMTSLVPGVKDMSGSAHHLEGMIGDPLVLLALAGAVPIASRIWPLSRQWPNWTLVLLYALAAIGFGFLSDIQAGGNVNYFFEGLFALTPFAVLGAFRLFSWSHQRTWIAFFVAGLFVIYFLIPDGKQMSYRWAEYSPRTLSEENRRFRNLEVALRGHTIFSLDPQVALLDPNPPLMEPYLLTYMRKSRHIDVSPLIRRISEGEFDVFVSTAHRKVWRGIRSFDGADLEKASADAYQPYCTVMGDIIELPRPRPADTVLQEKLRDADCVTVVAQNHQLR